ncbi:MAG TPA: IclR family transcriptional regulator [Microbacteriaceae bacterium]|nr:IclR family transcriptional regulator [Microbacteriaceae bacterium]
MATKTSSPAGGQSISRATDLLRILSTAMPLGLTTSDLSRHANLTRPTTHRILAILAHEGFVDRNTLTGNWLLGPELYVLGAIAAERYDITEVAAGQVASLARETGESAFLSARRGNESVCLTRVDGSFPIRSFVLYEGVRFPLGVASAGIAMLAFENDAYIDEYLQRENFIDSHGVKHSAAEIRERIAETRELGYSVNPGLVVEGSWGMAAAIFSPSGSAEWALSLTGVDTRFTRERRPHLGRLLLEHAHEVTRRLRTPKIS